MRFEMIEFVARVATSWAERGMAESPVAGVVILMEELFLQNLPSVVRAAHRALLAHGAQATSYRIALLAQALMNADDFRKYRLYNARVHTVLANYHGKLRKVFNAYVGLKKASVERRSRMFLDEFMRMLFDAQLFDEVHRGCGGLRVQQRWARGRSTSNTCVCLSFLQRFAKREARVCFTWARMRVVDDLRHRDLFCSLGFMGTCWSCTVLTRVS